MQSQARVTSCRLEQTQRDLDAAQEALAAERSVRAGGEVAAGALERELADEREDCENLRKEVSAEKDKRRRSEAQARTPQPAPAWGPRR